MNLPMSLLGFAIAGFVAPAAVAGQQSVAMEQGQKVRPDLVAPLSAAQSPVQKYDRVIGVCHLSANPDDPSSAQNSMSPPLVVKNYYYDENYSIQGPARVSVLKMPEHGRLLDDEGGIIGTYQKKVSSVMIAQPCWSKWEARKSGWSISSA